ncbi:MAG: M23 family metallopeptidase [Desulfuromonadaceae bacterium]|nr:M23 family metallopeptidase [Desulfuromonadaceae bacterium]
MFKLRPLLKRLFTPITIMLVPHSQKTSLNFKIPSAMFGLLLVFVCIGFVYTISLTVHALDYYVMKKQYAYMSGQFRAMQTTIHSLKASEVEFKQLFSLGSKKKVLEAVKQEDNDGSIDVDELNRQISESMKSVSEIKSYLAKELNTYRATPEGWPVDGKFSSGFGMRIHPQTGRKLFHSGVDFSAPKGTPVHVTADGIISVAAWSKGNGKIVVVEHGHGYSTVYAHNSRIDVKAGQTVKRGQVIAATGATGNATGPHVHYEVWKDGHFVNPAPFVGERRHQQIGGQDAS